MQGTARCQVSNWRPVNAPVWWIQLIHLYLSRPMRPTVAAVVDRSADWPPTVLLSAVRQHLLHRTTVACENLQPSKPHSNLGSIHQPTAYQTLAPEPSEPGIQSAIRPRPRLARQRQTFPEFERQINRQPCFGVSVRWRFPSLHLEQQLDRQQQHSVFGGGSGGG